jgi:UDP-glucose 6-dehydrogenase
MEIAMIGAGCVGLVSGACFSDFGFDVTCVDSDTGQVDVRRPEEMRDLGIAYVGIGRK